MLEMDGDPKDAPPSATPTYKPFVVAIGGGLRLNSSTEKALRLALGAVEEAGGSTALFCGPDLDLPLYAPEQRERTDKARHLVESIRRADGLIIGSPGYHGGISGAVKNAIDYVEDTANDPAPYLHDRAVGCVTTGAGWQGANSTLAALRAVVHALRGWPTPQGVAINTIEPVFASDGSCTSPSVQFQLRLMAEQVVSFAARKNGLTAT